MSGYEPQTVGALHALLHKKTRKVPGYQHYSTAPCFTAHTFQLNLGSCLCRPAVHAHANDDDRGGLQVPTRTSGSVTSSTLWGGFMLRAVIARNASLVRVRSLSQGVDAQAPGAMRHEERQRAMAPQGVEELAGVSELLAPSKALATPCQVPAEDHQTPPTIRLPRLLHQVSTRAHNPGSQKRSCQESQLWSVLSVTPQQASLYPMTWSCCAAAGPSRWLHHQGREARNKRSPHIIVIGDTPGLFISQN